MCIPITGAHFSASWNEKLTVLSASMATFLLNFEVLSVLLLRFLSLFTLSAIVGEEEQVLRVSLALLLLELKKNLEGRRLQMPTFSPGGLALSTMLFQSSGHW
jgi:hypothetical protein